MEKVKRVLQILTTMNRGGAETMIMNYYRALDKSKLQFDFLVHRPEEGAYESEIRQMGGRIYRAMPIRPNSYRKYFKFLDAFFKKHASEYIAIHAHIQENSGFAFKYAAKYGVLNRICTSHTADIPIDYKYPFRLFAAHFLNKYVTKRIACGEKAGESLYGKRPFVVIHNAIDSSAFRYDVNVRDAVRRELGIGDSFVIGNTARFCIVKNHAFMLDILSELIKVKKDVVMLFLGDGEERPNIERQIEAKHLQEHVRLLGVRPDVYRIIQAYDVFLFPSKLEGLPVSVIEAQAAGLKCFLTDTIDKSVDITGDITFLSLAKSPAEWAREIVSSIPYERKDNKTKIVKAGYDVEDNVGKLLALYTQGQ